MINKPLVSIVTPLYNSEKFIEETIKSVCNQSYTNWEMIIVDDCSTDNSLMIAVHYSNLDTRIKVLSRKNKSKFGAAEIRNIGILNAKGEVIAFLDSDDYWSADFLASQVEFLLTSKVGFVFSSVNRVDENSRKIDTRKAPKIVTYNNLLLTNNVVFSTVLVNRNIVGNQLMPTEATKREDFAFLLILTRLYKYGYGNQNILASYRIRKGSVSNKKLSMVKYQYNVYRNVEKIGFLKSIFYILTWSFFGFIKYRNINKQHNAVKR